MLQLSGVKEDVLDKSRDTVLKIEKALAEASHTI